MYKCVGLFGTCGYSTWRDAFIEKFNTENVKFFNPNVSDWKPELAEIEADNMKNDSIIVMYISPETYGISSLMEVGFVLLNAINSDRSFIILIDPTLNDSLDNKFLREESIRARKIAKGHLGKINMKNVYVVESLDNLLNTAINLYKQDI